MNRNYVVYVDIPALQNFVDYLREHDNIQSKVDALAKTITEINDGYAKSAAQLKAAGDAYSSKKL